jgi:hypothetical protein
MTDIFSSLVTQLSKESGLAEENISHIKIDLLPLHEHQPINIEYFGKNSPFSVNISSLPNSQEILQKFEEHLQKVTKDISFPENCYVSKVSLKLYEKPRIELSLRFQVPLSLQKSILSLTRQLLPSEILQKQNFHFANTVAFFDQNHVYTQQFSLLTKTEELAREFPKIPTLELISSSPTEISKEAGLLGSSNPVWNYGKTTIPYPAYRIAYKTKHRQQTFESTLLKHIQALLSDFNKPTEYTLLKENITLTNGKSTGRFVATLNCPITKI